MDVPLVGEIRSDDAHIDSALGRYDESGRHLGVDDQIGCRDPNIPFGVVDDLDVGVLGHIVPIEGAVTERLDEAIGGIRIAGGEIIEVQVFVRAEHPLLQEHQGKVPDRIPFEHDRCILPMAEADFAVDVFVGEVDAPGEAHLTIDHDDFTVVAIIQT